MNWGVVSLVACAAVLVAPTANAQMVVRGPGVTVASDFDAPPYDDAGPPLPPRYAPAPYSVEPRYAPPPYAGESYGPSAYDTPMLPPGEIVRIARQNGFSPLGAPQQRGFVYRLPALSPDGDDGRLVIDARNGRIMRFVSAMEYGGRFDRGPAYASGAVGTLPQRNAPVAALRQPSAPPRIAAPTTMAALPKPASAVGNPSPVKPGSALAPKRTDIRQAIPAAPPAALAAVAPATQSAPVPTPPTAASAMPPAQGLD